jgi:hypothetical protein
MATEVLVVEVVKCLVAGSVGAVAPVEVEAFHGYGGRCGVAECCVGPGVNLCSGGEHGAINARDGVAVALQMGCEFSDKAAVVSKVRVFRPKP